jgi:hypothetical protein
MNLQWLRHGNPTRTIIRAAGLALAALMISTGASAWGQAATRTQLSASRDAQGGAAQTVFTAKVAEVSGEPVSTGTVSFEAAKGSIGSAVVENGVATLRVDKLPRGTSSVTAVYQGGTSFATSSGSAQANADGTSTLPDFSVIANPTSVTLSPGAYGTITISITPENGFSEMVTLSCSGNPSTSTCVFSPTTLIPTNGAVATSVLQIQTQAASGTNNAELNPDALSGRRHVAYALVLPGMLALVGLGALRRRSGLAGLRVLGFVALLTASSLGLSSCAARYNYLHKPPAANPGIQAGTYPITIAAYATNGTSVTSHTLSVTLTVN